MRTFGRDFQDGRQSSICSSPVQDTLAPTAVNIVTRVSCKYDHWFVGIAVVRIKYVIQTPTSLNEALVWCRMRSVNSIPAVDVWVLQADQDEMIERYD